MGYKKDPKGVDLVIGPSVLTEQERKLISEIIVDYKRTGKIPHVIKPKNHNKNTKKRTSRKKVVA